jgi:cysteine desulfurase
MEPKIFLDGNATTPVDNRVLESMLPYFSEVYGNPASIDHTFGTEANDVVNNARQTIASIINAKPEEIIFTSGATEADNLALQGIMQANSDKGKHLITCVTEHPAVLETAKMLEKRGFEVTYLPVDKLGIVDLNLLKNSIRLDTVLVSIMAANNEIGTIAPIKEIGAITRSYKIYFHTDAAQTVGHIPINVEAMNIDCMSISAHKMHGPKGIGALYIRRSNPRVRVSPVLFGGGHERGVRPGTLNVPGVVGFAKALQIAKKEMKAEAKRFQNWRKNLLEHLSSECGGVELNGHPEIRIPQNVNLFIEGVENKVLINRLKEFAISAGSACSTIQEKESHVIQSLRFSNHRSYNSIRIGFIRLNTQSEVELLTERLAEEITAIRKIFG